MSRQPRRSATTEQPRRVLLLNWRDRGHPEGGGSEHFIEQLAFGLQRHGYDVTLRSAHYAGSPHEEWRGQVKMVRRGGRFTVYPRAMAHLLASPHRYDLVVDVQNGVPFWSPLVSHTPRILVVHHVHKEQWSVVFGPRTARAGWWLESRVSPRVYAHSRYATVSMTSKRELEALGIDGNRISVVYSGLDRLAEPLGDIARTAWPSLVVLGRLVPHKRIELAIDAVADLRKVFPDVTLTLVGQGWWEPQLREHAARLGVSDHVTFAGFVDEQTKNRLLAESWLHVLPSLKEGWGLTVVEAGSVGTPSVAYRSAGGTTESILDGSTGLLLDDDERLSPSLAHLITNGELRGRLGHSARSYAAQFTWDRTVERFTELAEQAISGGAWRLPTIGLEHPDAMSAAISLPTQREPEASEVILLPEAMPETLPSEAG